MKEYKVKLEHEKEYYISKDTEKLALEHLEDVYRRIYDMKIPKLVSIVLNKTYTNEEWKKIKEAQNIANLEQLANDSDSTGWTKDKQGNYYCKGKKQKTTAIVTTVKNKEGEDITKIEWE